MIERFAQVVPGAGQHAEAYLRTIELSIAKQQLPVVVTREEVTSKFLGGVQGATRDALIVRSKSSAHHAFTFFHYGFPIGANLAVGWYVTEANRGTMNLAYAAHVVTAGLAGLSDMMSKMDLFDQADLLAIFASVHQFAVMEAVYAIAEKVEFDRNRVGARSSGMFGIG